MDAKWIHKEIRIFSENFS